MNEPRAVAGKGSWPDPIPLLPEPARYVPRPRSRPAAGEGTAKQLWRRAGARLVRRFPVVATLRDAVRGGGRSDAGTVAMSDRLVRRLARPTWLLALQRMRRFPPFRAEDYLALHQDVGRARVDPAFHALFVGAFEQRQMFLPFGLARTLAATAEPLQAAAAVPAGLGPVGIYVSTQGNVFMRDIAEDLAASLRAAGAAVAMLDESAPIEARPSLCLFMAPHEFFLLGRGPAWVRDDVIAGSVMFNTEQPQTPWFGSALPFLLAARGVVDLSAQTAGLFARAGMPALHLTPAPHPQAYRLADADRLHPLFRVLPAAARAAPSPATPFGARPLDVALFATESPHREKWLARNAAFLADYECFLHYRRLDRGPIQPGGAEGALTRLAQHVSGHARIVLNVHRDAFGFLEWHRVVRLGMASGALVVSEPCLPHPLLRAGEHYLEEGAQMLPNLIEWLLRSPDGQQRAEAVRANAAALLATRLAPRDTAAQLLAFMQRATA